MEGKIYWLIKEGKEGDYWDFKEEKHHLPADLIHDIICLANYPHHYEDRLLIFGVSSNGNILGLNGKPKHTLSNIVDTLRNANFAGGVFPDVELIPTDIKGKEVEAIIIKNKPYERPYFLRENYTTKGKPVLYAGTIYSRVRDSNTPKNGGIAPDSHIEKMWRQRFGLDISPLERLKSYLLVFENWIQLPGDRENYWYYKDFPEFTIAPINELEEIKAVESWVRCGFPPNPEAYHYNVDFKYHQTTLYTQNVILFDSGHGGFYPLPSNTPILEKFDNAIFYYYLMDSFEFIYLQFLRKRRLFIQSDIEGGRGLTPPIVLFKNAQEKDEFVEYLLKNGSVEDIRKISIFENFESESYEYDKANIKLCKYVKETLSKWRNNVT